MEFNQIAVSLYILITVVVILFQLFLVFGAPWGEFTQGGRHKGVLPTSGRVSAAVSIPILIFMACKYFVRSWISCPTGVLGQLISLLLCKG